MKPIYPDKVESVMLQYREGKEKIQKEPNKQKKLSMGCTATGWIYI